MSGTPLPKKTMAKLFPVVFLFSIGAAAYFHAGNAWMGSLCSAGAGMYLMAILLMIGRGMTDDDFTD